MLTHKILLALTAAAAILCSCSPKVTEPKVMAREVPERMDDFIFENDLICYRIYGKALEKETLSPGFDVWVKTPGPLVADQRYEDDLQHGKSYHKDWGNGKDCYKVGVSLGAGASVPLIENRFQLPETNWRSSEIVSMTPEKLEFVLHYPQWKGDGEVFTLDKKITVFAGSYFVKVEDTYTFEGEYDEVEICAGIVRHDIESEESGDDWFAIWETASDQSAEKEDGRIGLALFMPGAEAVTLSHGGDHSVCIRTVKSGETVTYWTGSCWSKGDLKTASDWFDKVKAFSGKEYKKLK